MSSSSCVMTTENTRGTRHTEHCCLRPSLYQAGVWATGGLSGRLRLCEPKDVAGSQPALRQTAQPHGE